MSLFDAGRIGDLTLSNRIVMAPLGRARAAEPSREQLPRAVTYYQQRASAGLIVSEATHISASSVSRPGGAAIFSHGQVQAWRPVTQAVHQRGGRIFQQLFHLGRKAHQSRLPGQALPFGPSAIAAIGSVPTPDGPQPFPVPRELRLDEIPWLVADFRHAAENAKQAGFDGVEVHAANGFLIDQFLRDGTNQRRDAYGGSVENRSRFLLEIVDALIEVHGAKRVGVRVSPHARGDGIDDSDPHTLYTYVAEQLQRRGIAYLHLIEPEDTAPEQRLAPALRALFTGPLILCGDYTPASALRAIEEGRADFIAFGRLFISNPDLVERLRLDASFNEPDPATFYSGGDEGYIDYPTLARQRVEA